MTAALSPHVAIAIRRIPVSESHEERIAREEEYWTGPRLFGFGLVFLFFCVVVIYVLASL